MQDSLGCGGRVIVQINSGVSKYANNFALKSISEDYIEGQIEWLSKQPFSSNIFFILNKIEGISC